MIGKRRLWGIPGHVADQLEQKNVPVLTAWDFYALIRKAYHDRERTIPDPTYHHRVRSSLGKATVVNHDKDYMTHYRVLDIDDLPADDIVCLLDRFCHISHLAAMQKWGLTDRRSHNLMLTRPDNETVQTIIADIMKREAEEIPWDERPNPRWPSPFRLTNIAHPLQVRGRPVQLRQTRNPGKALKDHNGFARVSTIGQTFLDMLQQPALCGGMGHVLEVWDEHAHFYLDAIIDAVNDAGSVVKCRAGHIIEERLEIKHPALDAWQTCAQRGGSSRLDPKRPYIPKWSEKWMISLNV